MFYRSGRICENGTNLARARGAESGPQRLRRFIQIDGQENSALLTSLRLAQEIENAVGSASWAMTLNNGASAGGWMSTCDQLLIVPLW